MNWIGLLRKSPLVFGCISLGVVFAVICSQYQGTIEFQLLDTGSSFRLDGTPQCQQKTSKI